ncbi:Protein MCM10 homolog [Strongyloides ratti]|uniref:Protein MCM10 homolog n=1 Tax=Strongyloides ratti TaxID=34506 RepID=A0A090L456_STRRB|nr:Protein MCM10 homolog [Strongyloides ratti]CEF64591.1 Protein MCM10 homolog [Strongyloides ratti]
MDGVNSSNGECRGIENQDTNIQETKILTPIKKENEKLSRKRRHSSCDNSTIKKIRKKQVEEQEKEVKPNTNEAFEDLMTTFADDFTDDDKDLPLETVDENKKIKPNTDEAFEDLMSTFAEDLEGKKKEAPNFCDSKVNNKVENKKTLEEKKKEMVRNMKKASEPDFPSYDPFFGIRIKSPKIENSIFEVIAKDMHKVLVKDIKKTNGHCNEDYVTMGVIIEKSECKVSGQGKNYVMWKINGFRHLHESSVKVLLFGDCFKSHWKLQQGMTVAIVKPTLGNDDKGKDNLTTLMLTKDTQVIELGFCIDFGICKSMRTDGKPCSNVVNTMNSLFCAYHLEKNAQTIASRRGTFNSMYSQPNVKIQKQKLNNCHASPIKKISSTFSTSICPVRKINGQLPNKDNIHLLKEHQKQDILKNALKSASCSLNARAILKKQKEKEEGGINATGKKKKDNVEIFISKLREDETKRKNEAMNRPMIGRSFKAQLIALMNADKEKEKESRKRPSTTNISTSKPKTSRPTLLSGKDFSNDEIRLMLNKKLLHEDEVKAIEKEKEERYFSIMESREKIEEAATSLMEIKNVRIFTCTICKIKYHKKNPICIEKKHFIKEEMGTRRFFKCNDCCRRCITYFVYPRTFCANCKGRNFVRVGMKDERVVKDREELLVRGKEEKFINR